MKNSGFPRGSRRLSLIVALLLLALPVLSNAQVTLVNETVSSGLSATHDPSETCLGPPFWQTGGMAVGDFNNDGWLDLFWLGGGEVPDKLFINDGDGTFTDRAAEWGVDIAHGGNGTSVGDYNNDGFLDIYVTSFGDPDSPGQVGQHKLYHNNGDGTFTNVAEAAGVNYSTPVTPNGYGSAFGDYDLDGDLDLFVTSWTVFGEGNRLYRNDGDGTFTDVTEQAVGKSMDGVWGFQSAFADMDGDLYPELLISADFESSRYMVNNGDGTFSDMTVPSGTGLDDNGMGQTVADFDHNGLFDWYVTSVHLDNPEPTDNIGNMLYLNQGNHQYIEVSVDSGTNDGGWGWGTVAVDLDHDTWEDIVEVNGRPTTIEWGNEPAKLFYNNGDGTFSEIAASAGLDHADEGRTALAFDADNDGDRDVVVFTNSGDLQFYRNTTSVGSWLQVSLDSSPNDLLPPNGFGARVVATVDGESYPRLINGQPSYLGTGEMVAHFGLADAKVVDELRIEWSHGYVTIMNNVATNQHITVVAPDLADLDADGSVGITDLLLILSLWGEVVDSSQIVADLDNDGQVAILDLLTILAAWS